MSVTVFLAVCTIVLMVFNGWAAQPGILVNNSGIARGVAHYIMGYTAELEGAIDEAAEYYEQSISNDGASPVVRMRLALAYAQLDRHSDAMRVAKELAQLMPEDLKSRYFLALLYSQLKESDKASSEYEYIFKSLAQKDPDNSEFPSSLGQLYYAAGHEDQAMEQFALALKLAPENTDLLYIVGSYYLEKSRREEGVALLKRCLEVKDGNADCLNSLAYSCAEDNKDLDKALEYANAAIEIDENNAAYLDTRGWVYYRQGRYDVALNDLMRADKIMKDATILEHIAQVYVKLGNPDEARKYQQEKEQVLNADVKSAH